jgi:hypothetical protein
VNTACCALAIPAAAGLGLCAGLGAPGFWMGVAVGNCTQLVLLLGILLGAKGGSGTAPRAGHGSDVPGALASYGGGEGIGKMRLVQEPAVATNNGYNGNVLGSVHRNGDCSLELIGGGLQEALSGNHHRSDSGQQRWWQWDWDAEAARLKGVATQPVAAH